MDNTCEIGGVTYVKAPQFSHSCTGCAGHGDWPICSQLPYGCSKERVIWIKQEAPVAHIPNADGKQTVVIDTPALSRPVAPEVAGIFQTGGRKDDGGKLDVTLFFDDLPHAIEAVTEVLQWAVTKKQPTPYERGSWQGVEDFGRRYRGAQLRHELNRAKSFKADPATPVAPPMARSRPTPRRA